jgi:ABC-type lipoprotein release transport system permease subunit
MLIPRRRLLLTLFGVLLLSIIFSTSFSMFSAFEILTGSYLGTGRDIVVFSSTKARTVATGQIPQSIADSLEYVPGIITVSPEVIAPVVVHKRPVFVRGVTSHFFDIQQVEMVQGENLEWKENSFLVGIRVARNLNIDLGDSFLAVSARSNTFIEMKVKGIFSSQSPLDDEILAPLELARPLAGLPDNEVTLIRVKIDRAKINEKKLQYIVSQPHTLKVKVNPLNLSSPSKVEVNLQDLQGKRIERKEISIPGEATFQLPFGIYIAEVCNLRRKVLLTGNTTVSFHVNPYMHLLTISALNSTNNLPITEASVTVTTLDGEEVAEGITNATGQISFLLPEEEYKISVKHDIFEVVKETMLKNSQELSFILGKIRLNIIVLNATSTEPIKGAQVSITLGDSLKDEKTTNDEGKAVFFLNPDIYNVSASYNSYFESKEVSLRKDPTITFLLGPSKAVHTLTVHVIWANNTAVKSAFVTLEGENSTFRIRETTDQQGIVVFEEVPQGKYKLTVNSLTCIKSSWTTIDADQEITISLPIPFLHPKNVEISQWIKYVPETIVVALSSKTISQTMEHFYILSKVAVLSLAMLITMTATLSCWNIISTSMEENKKTIGLLRALGARKSSILSLLCLKLTVFSALTGTIGYFIGFILTSIIAQMGVLIAASHTLQPFLDLRVILASISLSAIIAAMASVRVVNKISLLPPKQALTEPPHRKIFHLFPKSEYKYMFLALFIPLTIRAIPEILMYPYQVGFDTLSLYIPLLEGLGGGFEQLVWQAVRARPFFYTVASLVYPWGSTTALKVFPTMLHGLLGLSSYLYARELFKKPEKALAASLLSSIYFVSLRVSWDLLCNEFALILLFINLTLIRKAGKNWKMALAAMASMVGVVLSHEGVSVIMFAATLPLAYTLTRRNKKGRLKLTLTILPPLTLYIYQLLSLHIPLLSNALGGWWYPSDNYFQMASSIILFFLYCYLPILPLAVIGIIGEIKDVSLRFWTVVCVIAVFLPLLSPEKTLKAWQRWAFMLVYPLSFYAIEGLSILRKIKFKFRPWERRPIIFDAQLPTTLAVVFIISLLTIGFIAMTPKSPFPYYNLRYTDLRWIQMKIPPSMRQNTLPMEESSDAVKALNWINENAQGKSCVLVDISLRGFAALYLNKSKAIWYDLGWAPYRSPNWIDKTEKIANKFSNHGFNVYIIGNLPSSSFQLVHENGNFAVYKYIGS